MPAYQRTVQTPEEWAALLCRGQKLLGAAGGHLGHNVTSATRYRVTTRAVHATLDRNAIARQPYCTRQPTQHHQKPGEAKPNNARQELDGTAKC
jgi:hypothetical protein